MKSELRRIFEDNYDYVWRSARRLGVQERDVDDIVHEIFLEVHSKLDQYDSSRPIRPWLFAFAVRFASDYRKLARHRTELRDDPEALTDPSATRDSSKNALQVLLRKDTARMLHAALEDLSIELRSVIVLYEIDEVPMKEITDALEIPLYTGYSRLRLARAQCAESIKRRMREEEQQQAAQQLGGGGADR